MRFRSLFFYLIILGLLFLTACAGKEDEEDALRLDAIEGMILAVFNEGQTDLAAGVRLKELRAINQAIAEEDEAELSEENADYLRRLKSQFDMGNSMFELDLAIHDLFESGVLGAKITKEDLEVLEEDLAPFEESAGEFFNRLSLLLEEAFEQVRLIEEATDLVDSLFEAEDVASGVTRADKEKAREAARKVISEEVRTVLFERLDQVNDFLVAEEEAELSRQEEAQKRKEEERKQKEEEEKKQREEEERQAKSIGDFAGYYVTDEEFPFLCEITEERFDCFVPESDVFDFLKIKEIVHNTGTEVTLILLDEDSGKEFQQKLTLLEDGKVVQANLKLYRITEEEFNCRADGC